jgi:uncharacterized protein (TIGR04551 family)
VVHIVRARSSRDALKTFGFLMRYLGSKFLVGIALLLGAAQVAQAQMTPGPMGPMGGGPQTPSGEEKKEGVAEAAPKTPGLLPTTPALPPPRGRRKRWKLLELNGYYRMRTDWFKNFNLGFDDTQGLGGAPFPRALSCSAVTVTPMHPCNDSLASTNMRLRLEPTINLDEGTSVHVQADVFDNLVLGSTPIDNSVAGVYSGTSAPPVGAFGNGQQAPTLKGVNSDRDSITVKRAWAEVALPLGVLYAGRMPNQWGMGIYHNAGGLDPINGTYNYDADYGDTVDRVAFSAPIPGTALRAMVATDWDTTRLVSNQTSANKGHEGHPFDLDDSDDTTSWVAVLSKMTPPQEFKDAVERGDTVLDYGVYFEYKTQSWDDNLNGFTLGGTFDSATNYVPRDTKLYTPDLWAKLGVGSLVFEGELVGQFGSIGFMSDLGISGKSNIRKTGGAGRMTWKGVEGKLRLGVEGGFASGDQWDNNPQGNTNIAYANLIGDPSICSAQHTCTLTQFMFNRDYLVDMILWRHLIGAVTNAAYAKPFLSYDLTKSIMFKVADITSFALKPVSTPGNSVMYGTEFDSDLAYYGSRMQVGLSFGVLFPMGAMSHPLDNTGAQGPGFGYGSGNTGDPGTAYTIQSRLVLTF